MSFRFNPFTNNLDLVSNGGGTGGVSNHSALNQLNWSVAGHTINTDVDFNLNDLLQVGTIDFDTSNTDAVTEGQLNWNDDDGTLQLGMPGGNVALQIGQEELIRVRNQSGSTISNGEAVYISGSTGAVVKVDKAKADDPDTSCVLGLATEDINNNSFGYITTYGLVRGINTNSFNAGDMVYLSDSTAGGLTNTPVSAPNCDVRVGTVIVKGIGNGSILVKPLVFPKLTMLSDVNGTTLDTDGQIAVWDNTNEYFDFTDNINNYVPYTVMDLKHDPTGFVSEGYSTKKGDISFDDGTRTFTIQPQSGESSFDFMHNGVLYQKTSAVTKQISDVTGVHVIYFDSDGVIQELVNPNNTEVATGIKETTFVSIIYWNASDSTAIYVGDERHKNQMSGQTHSYLHFTNGLVYNDGLGLNTMDVDGDGDDNSSAQFGVDEGSVSDEDIFFSISSVASSSGLPIYYMTGSDASPTWNRYVNAGYSVRTFDGTSSTRLAFNENNGGTWQLTEIDNTDYGLCHVFATTEKDNPMIAIMGQNQYASLGKARDGAETEVISLITDDVLFPEIRPIATIIFQTNNGYDNDVKSRVRSTDDGDDYIDWRSETISRNSLTTSDHNLLSNLNLAQDGVTYGHIDDEAQTIAGTKTFTETISGSIDGNSATVTNGVYTTDSDYIDLTDSGATTLHKHDHDNLDGKDLAQSGVTYGHINDTSQNISGHKTFSDNVIVSGDFTVNGTTTTVDTQHLQVEDNLITINYGETGGGVTSGDAGITVDRGTETNYNFMFDEASDSFVIGEVGDEQRVATREDSPNDGYIATWNDANKRFNTTTELSTDTTLAGDSDSAVPTEKAVKTYVDDNLPDNTDYVDLTSNQTIAGTKTFSSTISGDINGNSATATKLATARNISLTNDVSGSTSFDGSGNVSINATVANNSHTHTSANISDATSTNTGNKIVKRSSSGDFSGRYISSSYLYMSHGVGTRNNDTTFYSSNDNYIRKNNAAGFREALGVDIAEPAGVIKMFGGTTPPTGYLLCDGTRLNSDANTQYADLYSVIGTTYGGSGSNNFYLPDLRGASPVGAGTSSGYTQNETVSLGDKDNDQFQGHFHEIRLKSGEVDSGSTFSRVSSTLGSDVTSVIKDPISDGSNGTPRTGNVTHGKRVGVNFIIKY